jgi:hypothetical protein
MTPVFTLFSFIATVTLCLSIFSCFIKNEKKKKEKLFFRLSQEGTANNLTFCSQEILQNKVIGIDGIHRKIMILERIKNSYNCSIICLDEVQHCELVTSDGFLNTSNLRRFEIEKSLAAIELQFEFKNQAQPASITFYDSLSNSKRELALLKAKAEYWSVMLSKMLNRQVSVRA